VNYLLEESVILPGIVRSPAVIYIPTRPGTMASGQEEMRDMLLGSMYILNIHPVLPFLR